MPLKLSNQQQNFQCVEKDTTCCLTSEIPSVTSAIILPTMHSLRPPEPAQQHSTKVLSWAAQNIKGKTYDDLPQTGGEWTSMTITCNG